EDLEGVGFAGHALPLHRNEPGVFISKSTVLEQKVTRRPCHRSNQATRPTLMAPATGGVTHTWAVFPLLIEGPSSTRRRTGKGTDAFPDTRTASRGRWRTGGRGTSTPSRG